MELTDNAVTILQRRYLSQGETPEAMVWRVATAVAQAERADRDLWAKRFGLMIERLDFLPNSPCLANAGKGNGLAWNACYVLPVPDSVVR